jgi:hypothetical protein
MQTGETCGNHHGFGLRARAGGGHVGNELVACRHKLLALEIAWPYEAEEEKEDRGQCGFEERTFFLTLKVWHSTVCRRGSWARKLKRCLLRGSARKAGRAVGSKASQQPPACRHVYLCTPTRG